jgi:hypothetical protein
MRLPAFLRGILEWDVPPGRDAFDCSCPRMVTVASGALPDVAVVSWIQHDASCAHADAS